MTGPRMVVAYDGEAYLPHCEVHGYLSRWSEPLLAGYDLLGHAAHAHSRPATPRPPAEYRTDPTTRQNRQEPPP